jgi:hypothetical protein
MPLAQRLHSLLYPNCRPAPHDDSPTIVRAVLVALGRERHHPGQAPMLVRDLVADRDAKARDLASAQLDARLLKRRLEEAEGRYGKLWREVSEAGRVAVGVRLVPEDRRRAIVSVVAGWGALSRSPTAPEIAEELAGTGAFVGLTGASIARIVSDVAAEGWIVGDGKRPVRYSVARAEPVSNGLTNCDTCTHDYRDGDYRQCGTVQGAVNEAASMWAGPNTDEFGRPNPGATGCPGHAAREVVNG